MAETSPALTNDAIRRQVLLEGVKEDVIGMQQTKYLGMRVAEMTKVIKAGFEKADTVWPYKGI